MKHVTWAMAAALVMAVGAHQVGAQQANPQMSFFITSVGTGNGANLGGLAGADAVGQAHGPGEDLAISGVASVRGGCAARAPKPRRSLTLMPGSGGCNTP